MGRLEPFVGSATTSVKKLDREPSGISEAVRTFGIGPSDTSQNPLVLIEWDCVKTSSFQKIGKQFEFYMLDEIAELKMPLLG